MQTQEDVKRLQDTIDNMSSFGERIALGIRNSIGWVHRKGLIAIMFLVFGVVVGFCGNFLKTLFVGKVKEV